MSVRRQARTPLAAGLVAAAIVATVVVVARAEAADGALPPPNATFDYQIGEAYPPPAGVAVVSRDREASPADGRYNICYVNAFQTQPQDAQWWQDHHDDLLLKDGDGEYVVDGEWNEILLDVSTAAKRDAIAGIVNDWIDGCAAARFDAVEPDNLDSWTRSDDLLTQDDAMAFASLLSAHAHDAGLAIAQKNAADIGDAGRDAGLDFAVAEECGRFDECDAYTDTYGSNVIVIEYRRQDFNRACQNWGDELSVVLRDRDVTAPGSGTYVYDAC
jgi:hypothetical protein